MVRKRSTSPTGIKIAPISGNSAKKARTNHHTATQVHHSMAHVTDGQAEPQPHNLMHGNKQSLKSLQGAVNDGAALLKFHVASSEIDLNAGRANARTQLLKSLASKPIIVLVGPEEVSLAVHEGLLSIHSDFFKEQKVSQLRLPSVEPRVFDMFVQWLFKRTATDMTPYFDCDCGWTDNYMEANLMLRFGEEIRQPTLLEVAKLFKLSELLRCEELRDEILDRYCELWEADETVPDPETVAYIFENFKDGDAAQTSGNWVFRREVVQRFARLASTDVYVHAHQYPLSFWSRVAKQQRAWKIEAEESVEATANRMRDVNQKLMYADIEKEKLRKENVELRKGSQTTPVRSHGR